MQELLTRWALPEILIFIVVLAIAVRKIIEYLDWARNKKNAYVQTEVEHTTKEKEDKEYRNLVEKRITELEHDQEKIVTLIDKIDDKVDLLIESDRDDIKSFLTREHHYFCYQLKSIDDYSLECCERRYSHYAAEGGNSFIKAFMEDMRALPKHGAGYLPPKTNSQPQVQVVNPGTIAPPVKNE